MLAAESQSVTNFSPPYYEGFRAAVGVGRTGPDAPLAGKVPPTLAAAGLEADRPESASPGWEEHVKKELHPLDAFGRLLECAANNRPPGEKDQFRFRWFGLFYQGPEQDAFVLRVRLPGGRLRTHHLAGLAAMSQEVAGGCVVCNAQGGLDLPGIPVRDGVEALRRVEEIGLRSLLSGGDCVWAVRGGEFENLVDRSRPPLIYPLARELEQALAMERRLADLPAGCEVELCAYDETPPEMNAEGGGMVFQAASDFHVPDFGLSVPGFGALDVTLTAAQVVPASLELLDCWATQGERLDRRNTGLAAFCQGVGAGQLRERLTRRIGPLAAASSDHRTRPERLILRAAGVEVPAGCLLSGALERLSEVARLHGANELRLAGGQLFVPCAADPAAAADALRAALEPI